MLLRHVRTDIDVDLSLAWIPWETAALARAEQVDFGGVLIRVPSPEDMIVYKVVASRPKDVDDANALAQLHAARIDFARVRALVKHLPAANHGCRLASARRSLADT